MKIRITKKGLPKAQWQNSQPGKQLTLPVGATPNYAWTNFSMQPLPVMPQGQPQYEIKNEGTPVASSNQVIPIKKYNKNTWINKDQSKLAYGVNKGLSDAAEFLTTNPVAKRALAAGQAASDIKDFLTPIVDIFDKKRENNEIEKRWREDLMAMGPIDYTRNRGDYEMNTGMVDPYNTGAKSKGQFTNMFYTPMAQDGLSLGPISFSGDPVQRNIFQYATELSIPISETSAVRAAAVTSAPAAAPEVSVALNADFEDYAEKADAYIKRVNPNTDITGDMLASAAQKTFQKYGRTVPVELALAQLQQEGYLAKGKNNKPQRTRNPFNVGNTDDGSIVQHPDLQSGINTYYDLMARRYLNKRSPNELLENFVNAAGNRYAGDPNYETQLKKIVKNVQNTVFEYGGENMEAMKIRITGGPQQMEYGGQTNYGLDLGRKKVYSDMTDSPYENPGRTIQEVPEEYATIEAEKGETILTDVDGDGMREHMNIEGNYHENGGTLLAAEEGDFVFSNHKPKMAIKNKKILNLFGKTYKKGGYTPAEIAKQYDINKYKAVLQDKNADTISKNTAERMIANYEKKLGMLSLVQEAKKGFPQGIPAVAQSAMPQVEYGGYIPEMAYGGYLEQYQTKGEVKPRTIKTKDEFDKLLASGKYKPVKGLDNVYEYYNKVVKPGTPDQTKVIPGTPGKTYKPVENAWWRSLTPAQKAAHNAKVRKMLETPPYKGTPDRTEVIKGQPEEVIEERDLITYQPTDDPGKPGTPPGTPPGNPPGTPPDVPPFDPPTTGTPYGWTNPDIRNLGTALLNRTYIKKYPSVRRDVNPVTSDFRNMDWRGRAAELQGTYNSQMRTLGDFQSPTSLAANASFMAGQQGENLINRAIDPIEQSNVQIYNQVAARNADLTNQAMAAFAQNQFLRSADRAALNESYNQQMIDSNNAITQAMNTGDVNAAGIYNTNITESPYYYIDPRTQRMKFRTDAAKAAFEAARRSAGPTSDDVVAQYLNVRSRLTGVPEDQKDDVARDILGLSKTGRTSSTTFPFNPKMNRYSVQQPVPFAGYKYDPQQYMGGQ